MEGMLIIIGLCSFSVLLKECRQEMNWREIFVGHAKYINRMELVIRKSEEDYRKSLGKTKKITQTFFKNEGRA
jgi:hypothetical protein